GYGILHPPHYQEGHTRDFYKRCPEVAGKRFFLFLGRIHPKKGVDILVRAYLRLKKENQLIPDLVIAGPGLETRFGQSLREESTHPSIHFPGMLGGSAKWGAFYACE